MNNFIEGLCIGNREVHAIINKLISRINFLSERKESVADNPSVYNQYCGEIGGLKTSIEELKRYLKISSDIHTVNAAIKNEILLTQVTKEQRDYAKNKHF